MPNSTKPLYVVAVSGGIDSVALLDALCTSQSIGRSDPWDGLPRGEIIVAHFDHGIREDSSDDAAFVKELAKKYGKPFRTKRVELGKGASEETARHHRYAFLNEVCSEFGAQLITAHHANDVAETIAINIIRGTGWRGVAVMDNPRVLRPLIGCTKQEIKEYSITHQLAWREDSTNMSDEYLRNRIRRRLDNEDVTMQLLALRARQAELKRSIDNETSNLVGQMPYSRYFFSHCGDNVAVELLRTVCIKEIGESPAPPVRRRLLHAIKVAHHGSITHINAGAQLRFTQRQFIVEVTDKVVS